ncbi:ABC transporter permease [Pannonibacter phragmitetus]|jgi:ABC-type nickel/cobalt efflux system permease component RcnA|uniref:HoxN/HupN/NixA family nickel/cobalt transporter n=1 Tax=Pannonibacter phragmitetus TaxID=121719 RepID=UPI000F0314A5|nr:ABC transporter permease [Pannonibacter phragmitetus]
MWGIYQDLVAIQREIYLAFADRIGVFAATGDWHQLAAYLPMGILFGAVHALTPGHGKAMLATYLAGSRTSLLGALSTSLVLSFTHVTLSVLIVLLSLPLIRFGFGADAGRAPELEVISRILLIAVALWMFWQAVRRQDLHSTHATPAFGVMAGMIPCPLTLFVMTFAVSRGVPQAGVAFAAVMMAGIAGILATVALAAVAFRRSLLLAFTRHPKLIGTVSRCLLAFSALTLLLLAIWGLAR